MTLPKLKVATPRHTRNALIPGDVVTCPCGAEGMVVKVRFLWFFTRMAIRWYA